MSSVDETSIKFTWNASKACDGIQYSLNGGNWVNGDWPQTNITGLSANTQYSVKIRVKAQDSQLWTESSVKYATTYAYPYCTSAPDFKIGNNVKLDFYNPLNRSIQIRMWSYASEAFVSELITITGTSYTGFSDVKSRLYSSIPSKPESQYNIDVHYGNNKAIKVGGKYSINGNENPTFSNFTYEDTNATTKALTGNNQILVSGYSNLKATISTENKAYSNYGSPIKKYRLNVGSMSSVEKDYSSSAAVELSINKVNSPSITVTAIDGRSYTKQVPKTATFKAYFKPVIKSVAAIRSEGGVGSQVTLEFNGEWWNSNFGNAANSISNISYYYKKTTDSSWTKGNIAIIPTISENNFSGSVLIEGPNSDDKGFDVSTAYNIKMIVTDKLDSSNEYQSILGSGSPAIAIFKSGIAINQMYDEKDLLHKLQVNGGLKTNFITSGDITSSGSLLAQRANCYFSKIIEYANWYHIGKFKFDNQGEYAILDCYMGDGQNGGAEQNTHAKILLKQGWTGNELPIGVTTNFTQNYNSEYDIVISHIAKDECNLYIRLPFRYNDLTYVVNGSYHSFVPSNSIVSTPTYDRESTYYKLSIEEV